MSKFTNWIKNIRRRSLGLLEIENMINESLSYTNDLISSVQKANTELQLTIDSYQKSIVDIEKSLSILSSPDQLIPRLNSYTGKYYIALEYPPSRDYQPRWGYTKPPHPSLSKLFQKNFDEHCQTLDKLVTYKPFFDKINRYFSHENPGEPGWLKTALNAFDTALIYYFLADVKPKKYLEIGSGVSTLFAARAIKDHNLDTSIMSIDPDPRAEVDAVCDQVIRAGLETCDLEVFGELEPGDILFLDGSHRCFMNSDVTVFMMDVLPMLKPGVIIGIHDIVLPYDYPSFFKDWYWNEQYMLGVYLLAASERIKILMPAKYMSGWSELESTLSPILENWEEDKGFWLEGGSFWFTHLENTESPGD